jgi:hypothetical protein
MLEVLARFQGWKVFKCGDEGSCPGTTLGELVTLEIQTGKTLIGTDDASILSSCTDNRDPASLACARCLPDHATTSLDNTGECKLCPAVARSDDNGLSGVKARYIAGLIALGALCVFAMAFMIAVVRVSVGSLYSISVRFYVRYRMVNNAAGGGLSTTGGVLPSLPNHISRVSAISSQSANSDHMLEMANAHHARIAHLGNTFVTSPIFVILRQSLKSFLKYVQMIALSARFRVAIPAINYWFFALPTFFILELPKLIL